LSESVAPPSTETPWGETWADLCFAVLSDLDAPPVLRMAAWKFYYGYDETELRSLIAEGLAFREAAPSASRP
jgi:hypothetical protein